ncbi:MAG TPA: hypothetical protein VFK05_13760 [Polyangiaceae bacterium]|nr:hypothetical protein [Polyangiaceae bacterium]
MRNRYFYSMLLEPQDMAEDQAFHLGNVRRHAAELHGFGTVCGLRVEKTSCHEEVRVKAGVGLDCLGREIRVECDVLLNLHETVERIVKKRKEEQRKAAAKHDRERHDDDDDHDYDDECADGVDVYITLGYREQEERPVQAIVGPETCCGSSCQHSRVRSGFCFEVSDEPPHVSKHLHRLREELFHCDRERIRDFVCDFITGGCWHAEPDPCGKNQHFVGLARVRVIPSGPVVEIDNCAVRPLVVPTALLSSLVQYAIERTSRE